MKDMNFRMFHYFDGVQSGITELELRKYISFTYNYYQYDKGPPKITDIGSRPCVESDFESRTRLSRTPLRESSHGR